MFALWDMQKDEDKYHNPIDFNDTKAHSPWRVALCRGLSASVRPSARRPGRSEQLRAGAESSTDLLGDSWGLWWFYGGKMEFNEI